MISKGQEFSLAKIFTSKQYQGFAYAQGSQKRRALGFRALSIGAPRKDPEDEVPDLGDVVEEVTSKIRRDSSVTVFKIRDSSIWNTKDNGHRDDVSSYANMVKNQSQWNGENDSKPVLVLDDSCVNTQDYSCCLNGKVKEVMIAFDSVEAKEKFLLSTGVCSCGDENTFIRIASKWGTLLNVENLEKENYHCKRLCVLTKSMSHIFESFKINYKGKTHWVRHRDPGWNSRLDVHKMMRSILEDEECEEVFKKDFGESDEEVQGENDVSRVSDTEVEEENPKSKDGVVSSEQNGKQSEDPFNIYSLLNKDKMKNNKEASTKESLEYPPGFTPRENDVENVEMDNQKDNCDGEIGNVNNISDEVNFSSGFNTYKKAGGESMDSDHCRESEGSRKGGSILMLMDELSASKMSKLIDFLHVRKLSAMNIEILSKKNTCLDWHEDKVRKLENRCRNRSSLILEMIIDKGDVSSDTLHKRAEVVKSIQEVDKLCAMEASQKAKIKWAIEGDENSKYYHDLNLFGRCLIWSFLIHLNQCIQNVLEAEVSNEEIKKAVWDCGVDKSPGPDGFTFGFYKRFGVLIELRCVAAVKYFFHYSRIPKGCNSSFIALIPKTPEAKIVKDFRPISLIEGLYKIIAKILANHLVVVLGDIVNEVHRFVADRQILDGPFILNEVLQWCKLKKKHSFILKIDFEKAYDSVRWDYLDDVLRKFGFGEKWCGWIQECLRSSWGSVLVNGSPTEEF
ncbi:RNA-directed DNA polymerase, eukaryota, reverse transcriptase zinc-binding domain protein [Tanacetum coccineum]|uniref:RNA-directed DNA polymerase, eukaryota, reverse transcriptase zinc-binding domain protein n=1 Tax=Tanacetum coccineum TaxID=301880 RepID=A0ABQ5F9Y5_9ASTR